MGENMLGYRLIFIRTSYFYINILPKLFLTFFLVFTDCLPAQNYRFETLNSENGLSQNTVLCIFQDNRQFLWLGTYNGLNRYDGFNFKVYKMQKDDPKSISGQVFTSIVEDRENNLWIASFGGGLNKYNRLTDDFTSFKEDFDNPNSLPSNQIKALFIDRKGRLWIGTEDGLCRYDFNKKFIRYNKILNNAKYKRSEYILSICEDASGFLWLGTWNGLIRFNPETNNYKYYFSNSTRINSLAGNYIGKVYLDKSNTLWVGTSEGLNKYDRQNDRFIRHINPSTINSKDKTIKDILEDNQGNLWLATFFNGLQKFDKQTLTFSNYTHDYINKESISSNILFSLCEDRSGILWIGTEGGGASKLNKMRSNFMHYKYDPIKKEGLSNNLVQSIVEDRSGILWIGTEGGGLNRFDPGSKKNNFLNYNFNPHNPNSLVDDRIRTMCVDDKNNLWIGTEYGLSMFDTKLRRFQNFVGPDRGNLSNNIIFAVYQIKSGEFLIGTFGGGLNIYDRDKNKFIHFMKDMSNPKSISSNNVWCVYQDRKENIWIGTDNDGLNKFDIKKNTFIHYKNNINDKYSISSNKVLCILESSDGTLWIGTTFGINKVAADNLNRDKLKFINYTTKDGLPDNNIQSMIEDNNGNIWISTNYGISKFNNKKLTFENFDASDGLQSNEFFVMSCAKREKTGELILGGNNGFNIFDPDKIKKDMTVPDLVLTDVKLFNHSVQIGEKIDDEVILKTNITEAKEIELSYKQNIISFEFAALHYAAPEKNSYAYMMEGFDSDWNYIGNRNFAYYTSIPPGEYVFKVKAANQNGIWNNNGITLRVIIIPPFYYSIWFRVFVVLLVVVLIFYGYKLKVKRIQRREFELEKLINEKTILNERLTNENKERKQAEEELRIAKDKAESSERLKTEFLAQMSHEIRSPINTIFNFMELIKNNIDLEKERDIKESFDSIERAGDRIVRTIDLILNMSEVQAGSYECIYKQIDINSILRRIHPEFSYKAAKKNLELKLNINYSKLVVTADEYSLVQIFVNIIDNAIKYTNEGIIEISSYINDEGKITTTIRDTGIGISEDYLANIFTPFFQEEQGYSRRYDGNGLGLALVKKYTEMNNANIFVESKKGVGSTFTVVF